MSSMPHLRDDTVSGESFFSAVSWGAIIAGAFAAAAISLALLLLGSALGLSSLSPWSYPDAESVKSFTAKTAIWLIVMQWAASGLGGYITGRLRTKWSVTHSDEAFFRDTAHGFLTWAVATVFTASVLASAASAIVGGSVQAGAIVAGGAAAAQTDSDRLSISKTDDTNGYYIDSLFRSTNLGPTTDVKDSRTESTKILLMGLKNGGVPDEDKAYLAQVVSAQTGISTEEAAARVDNVISRLNATKEKAKQDAEEARKTAMHVSVYVFLSMLAGAFIASVAAATGGRRRDEY